MAGQLPVRRSQICTEFMLILLGAYIWATITTVESERSQMELSLLLEGLGHVEQLVQVGQLVH